MSDPAIVRRSRRLLAWSAVAFGGGVLLGLAVRRRSAFTFRGKAVLITGGSRGLGLVLARQLVAEGARVALLARDVAELGRAVELLGPAAVGIPCDVTLRADVDDAVARAAELLGGIDAVIHCAGAVKVGPLEHMTPEDYEAALRVHALGAVYTVFAALPWLRRSPDARVVNIASIGGKVPVPHLSAYCTGKFALTGFSEALRVDLAGQRIPVTTVWPTTMRTGSVAHARFTGQRRSEFAWFAAAASLPLVSTSAERAARRILAAARAGRAEVPVTVRARVLGMLHGLFPSLTSGLLGLVSRMLPGPGSAATRSGAESRPQRMPAWITARSDRVARRNNETDGH